MNKESATAMVLFGATGDLVSRKVIPSLFDLHERGLINENFKIIAFTRRDFTTQEYVDTYVTVSLEKKFKDIPQEVKESFLERFVYVKGDYSTPEDFEALEKVLSVYDTEGPANRLLYMAVYPQLFSVIADNLVSSGVNRQDEHCFTRLVLEKPFGDSLESAEKLVGRLSDLFTKDQLFYLDHYLGKPALRAISKFTFDNVLVKTTLLPQFVEKVEVSVSEDIDIYGRGGFYDDVGALVDVGQNHVLQMLATTLMHEPNWDDAEAVQAARAEILSGLECMSEQTVIDKTRRAQYVGYRDTEKVHPESATETYFEVNSILVWKNREVPVTFVGGKGLDNYDKKYVKVFFKCQCGEGISNYITFELENPEERISVNFVVPHEKGLRQECVDFPLREPGERKQYTEEYSTLFLEILAGDRTWFLSGREVLAQWRFIEPIRKAWKDNKVELKQYPIGAQEV